MTSSTPRRGLARLFSRQQAPAHLPGTHPVTRVDDIRRLVDDFELPATTEPQDLAAQLAEQRGRPIEILPYPADVVARFRRLDEPLPYGVWISGGAADYVFYRADATPSHQRHIILHELGHISCRHVGEDVPPDRHDDAQDRLAIVGAVKRAGGFAKDQEQAAESFAYLVERRTRPHLSATGDTPTARYRLLED